MGIQGERGPQGPKGDRGPQGESILVGIAEEQIARLIKAKTVPKWWGYVITTLTVALVAGAFGLGGTVQRAQNLARTVQQGSISQCEAGNAYKTGDTQIWDEFITLALGPHPRAADVKTARAFEAYIARIDAPRDCGEIYGNP